ncbi:MAG: TerC/Alx family metal homeostasis membrane protein [Clostridiales bacterium]|nr:TerC/Alx family metal homeostasis membrane protein [Clostridiales bacterium]
MDISPFVSWLSRPWGGANLGAWLLFHAIFLSLVALDLFLFGRRFSTRPPRGRETLALASLFILAALLYGGWIALAYGTERGLLFFTGYLVEEALSLDNILVMVLIFEGLAIPLVFRHRLLFLGILGAMILRGAMIFIGAALLARFEFLLFAFGIFLVAMGISMLIRRERPRELQENRLFRWLSARLPLTPHLDGPRFFSGGKATPLFLALLWILFADAIFALDSIPAIFSITTDPFLVYTSNMWAVAGLRALYFALASLVERFRHLKTALAWLLLFIGGKIFYQEWVAPVSPLGSLAITLAILGLGIVASLRPGERPSTQEETGKGGEGTAHEGGA